jgi:cell wall-associated NlpC family hydrolase
LLFYGTPYRFGGSSSHALDCSGFVQKVFRTNGIELPRDSRAQARYGYKVSLSELKPGDLLFFKTYKRDVSHVGIYIGDGKMVHAATRGGQVKISSIHEPYYRQRFLFAKRVVEAKGEEKTDPTAEIIEKEANR